MRPDSYTNMHVTFILSYFPNLSTKSLLHCARLVIIIIIIKEGGSTRLETIPNEGNSLEDYHVVWMLHLMNESLNWIQELKQENKNIYCAIHIIYTKPGLFKDQFRTAHSSNSMASAERELITGVWGQSPQWGSRGQSPRWGWGEGQGAKPPEAECLFVFACPKEAANLPHYWYLQQSVSHTVNEWVIV